MEVNSNENNRLDTSGDESIEENMQEDEYKTFEDTEMVDTATTSGVKRTSDGEVESHSKIPKKSDNCVNYEDSDGGCYSGNVGSNEEDNEEDDVEDNAEDNIESNAEHNEQNEDGGADRSNEIKVESKSAFDGHTTTHRIYVDSFEDDEDDAQTFFKHVRLKLQQILGAALLTFKRKFKAVFNLHGHLIDNNYEHFDITDTIEVSNRNRNARLQSACKTIVHEFNKQNKFGKHISYLDLHIYSYISVTSSFLPLKIVNYQHVLNVDSEDHASFKWAVLAALHPEVNHPDVHSLEKYSEEVLIDEIEHPVKIQAIPRIEELTNMSFNVYVVKNEEIEGPVYYSKCRREKHFNLLLLHEESKSHYCYIRDLGRLVDESKIANVICDGCLCFFEEEDSLQLHQKRYCLQVKTIAVADKNNILKYSIPKNGYNCHYVPIVVYAKFKAFAFLEPPANKDKIQEYRKSINKPEPYCFAYYIKCSFIDNDQVFKLRKYYGPDCVRKFIKGLKSDLNKLISTPTRKRKLEHISEIPVIFHNFTSYDGHFVITGIPSMPRTRPRRVIGSTESFEAIHEAIKIQNKEIELKFLDATNFLSGSLTNLVEKLNEELHELRNYFANDTSFRLVSQGIKFSTECITSHEDFNQTILPEITADFTAEEYERAQEVWHHFDCTDIQQYLHLHMKTSVILLADVVERLRSFCKTKYQTDPAKFHSISETSWEAMMKYDNVELELPRNVDMMIFLKNAVSNNTSFLKDKTKSCYLTYYTKNNLQDWAMSQPLPYGHFEWAEVDVDFHVPVDSEVGYFLEVDLMEPDEMIIKDWVVDLPFWPAKPVASASHGHTNPLERSYHILHHSYLIQCEEQGLKFKVNRVLKFRQKPWLASYVRTNKERMTTATSDLEKDYYKLLNKSIFAKIIQDLREYDKLETCVSWFKRQHNLGGYDMIGSPEYHSHSIASEKMIVVKLNRTKVSCDKPIYVGATILDLSKGHILRILNGENS